MHFTVDAAEMGVPICQSKRLQGRRCASAACGSRAAPVRGKPGLGLNGFHKMLSSALINGEVMWGG
jgi:hypothetical protein